MPKRNNNLWHLISWMLAATLGVTSLLLDWHPQFPSMCIILGIILFILIDTMETIPAGQSYHWHNLIDDVRSGKQKLGPALLFLHAKIVFPTLFTIYLILLITQKLTIVTPIWRSYAGAAIETLQLLWVVLASAVLANFSGLPDKAYVTERSSFLINSGTIILICLLSYLSMWAIFNEIAVIGRVAYFVSLAVWVLIAMVSIMILTEPEENHD